MEIYGPNDPETKKINKIILLEHEKFYDEKTKQLIKEIKEINDIMKSFDTPEVLERKIIKFGNSSHIILPKECTGKKAKVIIKR